MTEALDALRAENERLQAALANHEDADRMLMEMISEQQRRIEQLQVEQAILLRRVNPPDWPFENLSPASYAHFVGLT